MANKNAYIRFIQRQAQTPQSEPIPNSGQVQNSAGGYSFEVDQWQRLNRFLVLGSEGGSYYANAQKLTQENARNVIACIVEDGVRAVQEIVAVSQAGRAPKNTPAIFVLALTASAEDLATRQAALAAIPEVCRIGTHLFEFAEFVNGLRGWGRALRRGVANWYIGQDIERVAYQVIKYRQRGGWTHTDLLRLAHPKPENGTQDAVFTWVTRDEKPAWAVAPQSPDANAMRKIWAFEKAQTAKNSKTLVRLIQEYGLTREMIPTEFLKDVDVWDALLEKMPMTAMIRNLGVMSGIGLLKPMSATEALVAERLTDANRLRKARVHPIAVLSALNVYRMGYGVRGSNTWTPAPKVVNALDSAFELAFGAVQPTNKRTMLALDVSGSMSWGDIAGVPGLTPRDGSAAMAMVTARTEPTTFFTAFSHEMVPVDITARMRLQDVINTTSQIPMGGTDCALPMIYAQKNRIEVDTFIVYTDSETWFGKIHPVQALQDYRQKMGVPARLIVVGMVANGFSIADPNDSGMMDVVGFDTAAPNLMNAFSRGEI